MYFQFLECDQLFPSLDLCSCCLFCLGCCVCLFLYIFYKLRGKKLTSSTALSKVLLSPSITIDHSALDAAFVVCSTTWYYIIRVRLPTFRARTSSFFSMIFPLSRMGPGTGWAHNKHLWGNEFGYLSGFTYTHHNPQWIQNFTHHQLMIAEHTGLRASPTFH